MARLKSSRQEHLSRKRQLSSPESDAANSEMINDMMRKEWDQMQLPHLDDVGGRDYVKVSVGKSYSIY